MYYYVMKYLWMAFFLIFCSEDKYGLSEESRKRIYYEAWEEYHRNGRMAKEKYPGISESDSFLNYQDSLDILSNKRIANSNGITLSVVDSIARWGKWPTVPEN